MFPIIPNKLPVRAPRAREGVAPVDKIQDRSVPVVTESPSDSERRDRQERRQQAGPRIKGYDLRSGCDRRKSSRTTPIIDLDV